MMDTRGVLMLDMDPPKHTRYRLLVNKGFTPRMIGLIEQALRHRASSIVDNVIESGSADFVEDIAADLPLQAIAEIMGVPQEDRRKLFEWSNRMVGAGDPEYMADDTGDAFVELFTYVNGLAAERRTRSARRHRHQAPQRRDRGRTAERARVRHVHDAARGRGQRDHPQRDRPRHVRAPHPSGAVRVAEERPRGRASTTRSRRCSAGHRRCCTSVAPRPSTPRSADVQIKAGDRVVIWHISANRDEEVWDDPFVFDITRNPNPHVAFGGGGSHFCLGANLARMELKLILTELVTRLPDMQLAGEPAASAVELHRRDQAHAREVDTRPAGPHRRLSSSGGILSGPIDGPARTAAQYPHREATPGPAGAAPRVRVHRRARRARRRRRRAARPHRAREALPQPPRHLRGRRDADPPGAGARTVIRRPGAVGGVAEGVRTASGSRAVVGAQAQVARASRIWVEGVHDAELVERVWGDDLRVEGIVVERLDGADHLADEVRAFGPAPRPPARRAARPPGSRQQGGAAGRVGAPPARAGDRHALRRRVAGGATVGRRHRPRGRSFRRAPTGRPACATRSASTTRARCGAASSARSTTGSSSSSPSSPPSNSSSTSSPSNPATNRRRFVASLPVT